VLNLAYLSNGAILAAESDIVVKTTATERLNGLRSCFIVMTIYDVSGITYHHE
jgi:hypothetical protein